MKQLNKPVFLFILSLLVALIFPIVFAQDGTGTEVGGILWENTTWTLDNSPYIVTETVQIPENITLTIESGVTVNSTLDWREHMFLLNGIINAHGTSDNMITFDGGGDSSFFIGESATKHTFLDLDYCIVKDGLSFFSAENAHFNVTHSMLSDIYEPGSVYPAKNSFIEKNIFKNFCSFLIATGGSYGSSYYEGSVYIRNNLFVGRSDFSNDEYYTLISIGNYGNYTSEPCDLVIEYNSFLYNDKILKLYPGFGEASISAPNNYWGTTNTTIIDSMIYDKNDDITCAGFIDYLPILTEPHPETSVVPPPSEDIITTFVFDVIDGDTFDTSEGYRIRLADVDAPEDEDNYTAYMESTSYLTSLIQDKTVFLDIDSITGTDPYGRYVCLVFVQYNSTHLLNVNKALLIEGYAEVDDFTNNEFDPNNWVLYYPIALIPEFPSWIILPLFLVATLFGIIVRRKIRLL